MRADDDRLVQIKAAMETQGISKTDMAARMKTSRRQLDPEYSSVTLMTLRRAVAGGGTYSDRE
jgi:antitoxin HicB